MIWWAFRFHGFRHAHGVVIRFDFREAIDHLLLARGVDTFGQVPAWLGEMRALEDGQGCPEPNGGRSVRVVKQIAESFDRTGGEVAHTVLQNGDVFALGRLKRGLEQRLGSEPVVNGGAVDTGVAGCVGGGTPLSKGGDDLGLNRRQVYICVGIR